PGRIRVRVVERKRPQHRTVDGPRPGAGAGDRERTRADDQDRKSPHSSLLVANFANNATVARPLFVVNTGYKVRRYSSLREAPVSRDTTSAACRRGIPAATSSATASRAPGRSRSSSPGPSTSVISPFGGFAKRAETSAADPRTTSSNFFVSSRQTASSRPGCAAASERSVAGNRWGDSNATTGYAQPASSRHRAVNAPAPRGRKPTN